MSVTRFAEKPMSGRPPSEYATYEFTYNKKRFEIPIKLKDEKGVIYSNGAPIPNELKIKINAAAIKVLKSAEEQKLFSAENPIKKFARNGIVTQNDHCHDLSNNPEWQIFAETVGWTQPRGAAPAQSSDTTMTITYPRGARDTITGSELALLGQAQLDPGTLKPTTLVSRSTNSATAYSDLSVKVKLRILKTLLITPAIATNKPLYNECLTQLRLSSNSTAEEQAKAIRAEIRKLEQLPQEHFLDEINRHVIDSLYTDFLQKPAGQPISKEMTYGIKRFMNGRFARKETLVEHYRAICTAKKQSLPAFTNTPEAFRDYWLDLDVNKLPLNHQEIVTNFMEAMVSWADTDGVKLERNYCSDVTAAKAPQSYVSAWIPECVKGRDLKGVSQFLTSSDAAMAAASYLSWPATQVATAATNQAVAIYSPAGGLLDNQGSFLSTSVNYLSYSLAAIPLVLGAGVILNKETELRLGMIDSGEMDTEPQPIVDSVVKINDAVCDGVNAVAQKLQTTVNFTTTVFNWAALPFKAAAAVYNYGPIARTRKAYQAVKDTFTAKK